MGELIVNPSLRRKLARDLAASRGRIVLGIVAIASCLIVFGTVLIAASIVGREFDRSYRDTQPAAATVLLHDGLAPAEAESLRRTVGSIPGVRAAAVGTQLTTRLMIDHRWSERPLEVFIRPAENLGQVARIGLDQGVWPPPADGILIERDAIALLGLSVGDQVMVTAADGVPVGLRVVGIAHDPSLPSARQEQRGYAYATPAVLRRLGRAERLDQMKITTETSDQDAITTIARVVAERAQAAGSPVDEIQVPEPGQHPHRSWVELIRIVLLVFGGTAFLLSALLVATVVSRLVVAQVPQIGAMKAIGGRTGPIVRYYLTMSLAVSTVATGVAVIPAALLGRGLAVLLLRMYDTDATSLAAPWWCEALIATVGVLLAPLLALAPTLKACRTTVRAALDQRVRALGPIPKPVGTPVGWLQALTGRLPLAPATALGVRNSLRRPGRFLFLVVQLALAGGLFVGAAGSLGSLYAFTDAAAAQQRWDAEVDLAQPVPENELAPVISGFPDVTEVEYWTVVPFTDAPRSGSIPVTGAYPDQGHGARLLAAVPPTTQLLDVPLVAGRWLRPGDRDAVVLDQRFAADRPEYAAVGQTVTLEIHGNPHRWQVVGLVRQKLGGGQAFVTPEGLAAATGRPANPNRLEIGTTTHDPATQTAVADRAAQALQSAGFAVESAMPIGRLGLALDGHVYAAGYTLVAVAALIGISSCFSSGSTTSSGVLERVREFGVMRAIGASAGAVRRMVWIEALSAAVCGIILGIAAAVGVSAALNLMIGTMVADGMIGTMVADGAIPFRFSLGAAAGWALGMTFLSVLAATPPARYAAGLTVRDAISQV